MLQSNHRLMILLINLRFAQLFAPFLAVLFLPLVVQAHDITILMSADGFDPDTVVVDPGQSVTFLSMDNASHWPASNIHPTHTLYPGSDVRNCETGNNTGFDACHGLAKGESYTFTFKDPGSWGFHDHLHPTLTGSVTVRGAPNASPSPVLRSPISVFSRLLAWIESAFYSYFPSLREERLHALNMIQVVKSDASVEFWMRVFG